MDLPDIDTALGWRGRTVHDEAGERIGTLEQLYLDAEDDRPAWAGVRTGLLGLRESFVPLAGAREDGDALVVPHTKTHVRDAPSVDPDAALDPEEEAALRRHYGLDDEPQATGERPGATVRTDDPVPPDRPGTAAEDPDAPDNAGTAAAASAPTDDPVPPDRPAAADVGARAAGTPEPDRDTTERGDRGAPVEMIRSEEEVVAGTTAPQPTERVRLRKVRVTENVTRTVPVRREEVRLEHEPPPEGRIESVEDVEDDRPA